MGATYISDSLVSGEDVVAMATEMTKTTTHTTTLARGRGMHQQWVGSRGALGRGGRSVRFARLAYRCPGPDAQTKQLYRHDSTSLWGTASRVLGEPSIRLQAQPSDLPKTPSHPIVMKNLRLCTQFRDTCFNPYFFPPPVHERKSLHEPGRVDESG